MLSERIRRNTRTECRELECAAACTIHADSDDNMQSFVSTNVDIDDDSEYVSTSFR